MLQKISQACRPLSQQTLGSLYKKAENELLIFRFYPAPPTRRTLPLTYSPSVLSCHSRNEGQHRFPCHHHSDAEKKYSNSCFWKILQEDKVTFCLVGLNDSIKCPCRLLESEKCLHIVHQCCMLIELAAIHWKLTNLWNKLQHWYLVLNQDKINANVCTLLFSLAMLGTEISLKIYWTGAARWHSG